MLGEDERARASRDLNDTIEALEAIARQLPEDADTIPEERITSAEGRRILASEPRRFSRIRLGSRRQVFVDLRSALEASVPPRAQERDRNLDGLFQQILATPDDDAPRLVFADAIAATDPEYGEFITVQMRLRDDARRGLEVDHDLVSVAGQRLEQYEDRWVNGLQALVSRWEFRGGFVEFVELPAHTYAERAEAIFSVAPVREVSLTSIERGLSSALAHPTMQRVRTLRLTGGDSLDELARHSLANVTVLDVVGVLADPPALSWPRLETVVVRPRLATRR